MKWCEVEAGAGFFLAQSVDLQSHHWQSSQAITLGVGIIMHQFLYHHLILLVNVHSCAIEPRT